MPKRPAHHRVKIHMVYTIGEAAEVLGVHRQTVVRWIRKHGLSACTERKTWLIRGTDLKTWLIACREEARTAPRYRRIGRVDMERLLCRSAWSGVSD